MGCQCMNLLTVVERNHEIDATDIDGEKVMMDLEQGQYFMLNDVGSTIWDLLEQPISVHSLIDKLMAEYEVKRDECEIEVKDFLHEMHHTNLVMVHA